MVDAPIRFDAESLSLTVGKEEFGDVGEGEGNMLYEVSFPR